jgi:hypothetical protein
LVVYAEDLHGQYLIAVEAKADESFGETMGDAMTHALERYLANNRSNGLKRITQLAQSLLGARETQDPPLWDLRYQLLTATAGALSEAARRGYTRALLLIHEFVTNATSDEKHTRNALDLDTFVTRISHGLITSVPSGTISGPFALTSPTLSERAVAFYIGKVSRHTRDSLGIRT